MCRESLIDFEKYEISENGTIWSKYTGKYFNGTVQSNGYLQVKLRCKDGTGRQFGMHRVIWYYFNGEIPEEMQVNHIDENKLNNCLFNLNLMSPLENSNWGTRGQRISDTRRNDPAQSYKILRINPSTGETKIYPSIREAGREGFNRGCIRRCIDGIQETSMGYKWSLILT